MTDRRLGLQPGYLLDPQRLFGTFDRPNDERQIEELESVYTEVAEQQPEVFRRMVSAHLRHHTTPLEAYAASYQRISQALIAHAGDS